MIRPWEKVHNTTFITVLKHNGKEKICPLLTNDNLMCAAFFVNRKWISIFYLNKVE